MTPSYHECMHVLALLALALHAVIHNIERLSLLPRRTFAMVKPDAVQHLGKIMHAITQSGLSIG